MVLTPWGDSESLRTRMLHPGPGTPRDQVVANQRERLFGAMVASVAERGYEATRVTDLVGLSGVSSRTFYDLFESKRDCFLATMEAIVEGAVAVAALSANEPEDWEERAWRGFEDFATMIVAQPAAARMCLVEAYAAGPEAVALLERAISTFEVQARNKLSQSPERAAMPPEMVTAHVGAMREIARARLVRGAEAELPQLMSELWDLILEYRPPPRRLRHPRPRIPRPKEVDPRDHAERALAAFAAAVAEQGYAKTTVDQIVKRASMSATTFYDHFEGKRDALMAALDSCGAQMVAAAMPAFRRAPDWANGIRAALGAMFKYLASQPAFARLVAMEVYAAGPEAVERRAEAVRPLEELIGEGHSLSPDTPPIAVEAITGGIYTLAYRRIRDAGPQALPALAPICTYIAVAPFTGPEQACVAANGDGRRRALA